MNTRQTAVSIAVAVLFFLASCFPARASDVYAGKAGFVLTEQSLENLRKNGLPDEILKKLENLKDKKIDAEDEFLGAVRNEIGNEQTAVYKEHILQHSAADAALVKSVPEALRSQNLAIEELRGQNRELMKRLAELEAGREESAQEGQAGGGGAKDLARRVKELEDVQVARDDAARMIIRDAISTMGSKINESVSLGGTFEVTGGWTEDFAGRSEGILSLSTVQLDFEIEVNNWTRGSIVVEYDDGTNVTFPTTNGFQTGVDRVTLDTAYLVIGDPQRFPLFMRAGRIILPFGSSTGDPVADVLTIEDPITIEGFEMRRTAVGIGLGFPTPAPTPPAPPAAYPKVRPLVINPLFSALSESLGYRFPPPGPSAPVIPTPAPPLFSLGVYSYDGETFRGVEKRGGFRPENYLSATAGVHLRGHCGLPLDQLRDSFFCPWSLDVDVDYNSSVFDSRFLAFDYQGFLGQIGFIDGMATSVKSTFGPVSFVGEWNGAVERARFTDDSGIRRNIRPYAWQIALGYQFDWNPWVEAIGAQGDYFAFSYSESNDLAGVTRVNEGQSSNVGFLPRKRFMVSVGEWVLDNLRFAIEYSHNWDYSRNEGGTGRSADGFLTQLTLVW